MTSKTESRARHSFLRAAAMIGLSAGLFAGMTESPVGAALVGSILGLVGASGVWGMFVGRARAKAGSDDQDPQKSPGLRSDPDWDSIDIVARGSIRLCGLAIVGAFLGVIVREGYIFPKPGADDASQLLEISQKAKHLDRKEQLKLLLLQAELRSLGVDNRESNYFVSSFIPEVKGEDAGAADLLTRNVLGEDNLKKLKGDAKLLRKAIDASIGNFVARDLSKVKPDSLGIIDDDSAPIRLKSADELRYGDVVRAHSYLVEATKYAEAVSEGIERGTAPDLTVVLDLVARYREESLFQPAYGRASPLVKPSRRSDDWRSGLKIKP